MGDTTPNPETPGNPHKPGAGVAAPAAPAAGESATDAPRKEVVLYAVGNIENGVAYSLPMLLQQFLIMAFFVNPVLMGLVIALKNLWDSVTDPVMAHITDHARTRWGRRIPFILTGGLGRSITIVLIVLLFPVGESKLPNAYLETANAVSSSAAALQKAYASAQAAMLSAPDRGADAHPEAAGQRKQLDAAARTAARIEMDMPRTIAVLHANLDQRTQWAAAIDTATTEGRTAAEKRAKIAQEVRDRLTKANALLADASGLRVLIDAARARLDGTLDDARRLEAETVLEKAKSARIETVLRRLPAMVERWNREVASLRANPPTGTATRKREAHLANAVARLEEAQALLVQASTLHDQTTRALAALAAGASPAVSPALPEIDKLVKASERLAPPSVRPSEKSWWQSLAGDIVGGWDAFFDPANADQRNIILYLIAAFIVLTTFTTVHGVPYFAMGIELCPSYDGRTRVAVYRAVVDKAMGILNNWVPAFCFLALFAHAIEGLRWVVLAAACIGIPANILMCMNIRERTRVSTGKKPVPFLKSISTILQSAYFWRVFLLYQVIGVTWGIFMQFGIYLNVYWVMGSASKGAGLSSIVGTLAWGLSFAVLPLVSWGCRKFQKHNVIQVAVILMSIGAVLQWWTINPDFPWLQLIQPFFTSIGISSFYVVMGAMLADVTDADELAHGERREGMFAAVMAFVGKMVGATVPIVAGLMLVVSGFDAQLEYNQSSRTILNMRLLYSIIPGILMLVAILLLWRYPLGRQRMAEIKAELKRRHDAEDAATQAPCKSP